MFSNEKVEVFYFLYFIEIKTTYMKVALDDVFLNEISLPIIKKGENEWNLINYKFYRHKS